MTRITVMLRAIMMKTCKTYMHFSLCVYLLVTTCAFARSTSEVGRQPANFVPDDDLIVVPMVIEKNVLEKFNEKHQERFYGARKQLEYWLSQEQYAEDYGLEDSGFVILPTPEEKERFFRRNYLRFISKDVERSTNRNLQNTLERWTADDEIDAIEAVEQHEKVLIYAKKKRGKEDKKIVKSVKVGEDKIKFGFQARPEIGMAKFTLESNYFYARAWVGINGNQELNIERTINMTNTKLMGNYFIDESRILVAVDQPIVRHWSFRFTHSKLGEGFSELSGVGIEEDNITQIRFNMGF